MVVAGRRCSFTHISGTQPGMTETSGDPLIFFSVSLWSIHIGIFSSMMALEQLDVLHDCLSLLRYISQEKVMHKLHPLYELASDATQHHFLCTPVQVTVISPLEKTFKRRDHTLHLLVRGVSQFKKHVENGICIQPLLENTTGHSQVWKARKKSW